MPASAPWKSIAPGEQVYAAGNDMGAGPTVTVYDANSGQALNSFSAFDPNFLGGVRVATGDYNGDGVTDIIAAPGPGGGPNVRVFSGATGQVLASFFAYEPSMSFGVNLAVGDLDGDGKAEIVTAPDRGGGPRVVAFHGGDLAVLQDFYAYDPSFTGGVSVAIGNFGGSIGRGIATAPGAGGGPQVKVFSVGNSVAKDSFFAYGSGVSNGVTVAAADLDGDGRDEIVTSLNFAAPNVRAFNALSQADVLSIYVGDPGSTTTRRVAGISKQGKAAAKLLIASAGTPETDLWSYTLKGGLVALPPTDANRGYGITIG